MLFLSADLKGARYEPDKDGQGQYMQYIPKNKEWEVVKKVHNFCGYPIWKPL